MSAIPNWLLGRHVTSVVAVLQQATDAAGVLSPVTGAINTATLVGGTPKVGLIDECEIRNAKVVENVNAVTHTHANHLRISKNDSLVLTEVLQNAAASALLANLWFSTTAPSAGNSLTRIVSMTFVRLDFTWTGYFRMTDYAVAHARGKNVGRMSLQIVAVS